MALAWSGPAAGWAPRSPGRDAAEARLGRLPARRERGDRGGGGPGAGARTPRAARRWELERVPRHRPGRRHLRPDPLVRCQSRDWSRRITGLSGRQGAPGPGRAAPPWSGVVVSTGPAAVAAASDAQRGAVLLGVAPGVARNSSPVSDQSMDLSLVVPAYNEESRLPPSLTLIRSYLDATSRPYEVLVVDDGSRDLTRQLVQRAQPGWPQLQLTTLADNQGKGAAVRVGMLAAAGRLRLFSDADLST